VILDVPAVLVVRPVRPPEPALDELEHRGFAVLGQRELDERSIRLVGLGTSGVVPSKREVARWLGPFDAQVDDGLPLRVVRPAPLPRSAERERALGPRLQLELRAVAEPLGVICSGSVTTDQTTSIGASIRISRS
jgi:hypothetical protein